MAGQRDRILVLKDYIESLGIEVNIGKNRARGNKGFFKSQNGKYRIDISKCISDIEKLKILVHEFSHYVHYKYDKTLKSLNFIFNDVYKDYEDDLINLTVDSIPKSTVSPLFNLKTEITQDVNDYNKYFSEKYSDYVPNKPFKKIEKSITQSELRYLLKYDRVKIFSGFQFKIISLDNINELSRDISEDSLMYLKLKVAQRKLRRINSKISRLNKYYNSPTELFARSLEYYICDKERMKMKTPDLYKYYDSVINANKIPLITDMLKCL